MRIVLTLEDVLWVCVMAAVIVLTGVQMILAVIHGKKNDGR